MEKPQVMGHFIRRRSDKWKKSRAFDEQRQSFSYSEQGGACATAAA
jgi:hypothetical protein